MNARRNTIMAGLALAAAVSWGAIEELELGGGNR